MTRAAGKQGAQDAIARQWVMLRQVPRYPQTVTASSLVGRLAAEGHKVTKRTVERDLQTLSAYFPLVCSEEAKPFRWSWQKDAPSLDLPGLSPMEALMFQLAERHLGSLLPATALKALAPHFRLAEGTLTRFAQAKAWARKIRVVPTTQPLLPPKVSAEVYVAITDALLNERQLKAIYRRRGDQRGKDYNLNPLALVQRGGVIYLVATAYHFADPLLFALHRFKSAECIDVPARLVEGFDIDAYIANGGLGFGGDGDKIRLEALFEAGAAEHLAETALSADQVLAPTKDGRVRLKATVVNTPQLHWWLLGFGESVEVLRPGRLRKAISGSIEAMAKQYA